MLKRLFKKIIFFGHLTIRCRDQRVGVFGRYDASVPPLDVAIHLRSRWALWKLALNPGYQLGELYMQGALQIERGGLADFLELCGRNQAEFQRRLRKRPWSRLFGALARAFQRNTRRRSIHNVAHHYDLSTLLYRLFLDEDLQYSCAYFSAPGLSLEDAQRAKKDHIAAKLLLEEGQRILDIGSGWGGLALSLAGQSGNHVVGVTLSSEQLAVANQRATETCLTDKVEFRLMDYRDVEGQFDRIVSVGMFEHVGPQQYEAFFQTVAGLLAEDGVAVIHSIGHKDVPGPTNAWIKKYIFPGGHIPALSEVIPCIEKAGLWITDIEILRLHYADTLHAWLDRFNAKRNEIKEIYDEKFCRMWEFYLAASEMSFRHGGLMVFQIQLAKRVDTVPRTRNYIETYEGGAQRLRQDTGSDQQNILEFPRPIQKNSA